MSNKTIKLWNSVNDLDAIIEGADAEIHLKRESGEIYRGVIYFTSRTSQSNFGVVRLVVKRLGMTDDTYNIQCTINHVPIPSEYGTRINHLGEDLYAVYHLDKRGLPVFTGFYTEKSNS